MNVSIKLRPKNVYDFLVSLYCFILALLFLVCGTVHLHPKVAQRLSERTFFIGVWIVVRKLWSDSGLHR